MVCIILLSVVIIVTLHVAIHSFSVSENICFTAPGCSVIRVNLLLLESLTELMIGVSRSQGKMIVHQKPR